MYDDVQAATQHWYYSEILQQRQTSINIASGAHAKKSFT